MTIKRSVKRRVKRVQKPPVQKKGFRTHKEVIPGSLVIETLHPGHKDKVVRLCFYPTSPGMPADQVGLSLHLTKEDVGRIQDEHIALAICSYGTVNNAILRVVERTQRK